MPIKLKRSEPEIIVRKGKPAAVIVPPDEYREMLKRLEDVDDESIGIGSSRIISCLVANVSAFRRTNVASMFRNSERQSTGAPL